jgi:hypothetical protein
MRGVIGNQYRFHVSHTESVTDPPASKFPISVPDELTPNQADISVPLM